MPMSAMNREELRERISRILSQREKHSFTFKDQPLVPAAVLLPIYEKDGEYHVLLTRRTEKMLHHKGQICFPGGKCHAEDASPLGTALREAEEEVGLHPVDVDVLGELDRMCTASSNYLITPYVGLIPHPYHFTVSPDEIDELVEMPLSALLDRKNYYEKMQYFDGIPYLGSFFDCEGKVIWGATARILRQFLDLIF